MARVEAAIRYREADGPVHRRSARLFERAGFVGGGSLLRARPPPSTLLWEWHRESSDCEANLYSRRGEIRELKFRTGESEHLTGASKTASPPSSTSSTIAPAGADCNVADGVIRQLRRLVRASLPARKGQISHSSAAILISGERTSPDIYMDRGSAIDTPPVVCADSKNTTVSAVETFLGAAIGISENEHRPPTPTREPLEANFRHALLFSFQDQNDIDSKQRLFHRQGEDFISQAIKDTLPYFLGAVDEDRLFKQAQLDQARRHTANWSASFVKLRRSTAAPFLALEPFLTKPSRSA